MKKMQKISYYLIAIILGLAVATITLAFTGPSDDPPSGDGYFWRLSGSDLYYPPSGSGSIGIGTASPSYKLDVSGTFRATATSTFSGNVGIGTTGPDAKLHIIGSVCAEASDTGCAPTSGYVRGAALCIGADCKTSWPAGTGTVTSVGSGWGLTGGPITTSGTLDVGTGVGMSISADAVAIDTTSIGTCTSGTTAKIIWDGTNNRLTCGTDQGMTGAGSANEIAIWSGASGLTYNSQLSWDAANSNLIVGTPSANGYKIQGNSMYLQGAGASSIALLIQTGEIALGSNSTLDSGGGTSGHVTINGSVTGTSDGVISGSNSYSSASQGVYGYGARNGVKGSGGYAGVWGVGGTAGVVGDGGPYGVQGAGTTWDFYAQGAGGNYGPFTGAHEALITSDVPKDIKPGSIMSLTGQTHIRYADDGSISLSSTLPAVTLSSIANDKKVIGVLVKETSWPDDIWYKPQQGERYGIVNALGEGRVLVTNINGNIEAGDYITTSPIAGYGQKQDDDIIHSYTLGKITEDVDWEKVNQTVEFNGKPYKSYLIGVIYVSG